MFAPLIAKAKADSGRPKTSVSERTLGKPPMLVRKLGPAADMTGLRPTSSPSWDFARIPLSRPDQPCPLLRAKAAARDEGSPEEHESESPCGDCRRPADQAATNDCTASDRTASQGKSCGCAKCTSDESGTAVPMQATPPAHTYTLVPPRGSYGDTAANITPPTCTATAAGGASMTAGSAAPTIRVFANGTYQVDRNDGVRQTATCTIDRHANPRRKPCHRRPQRRYCRKHGRRNGLRDDGRLHGGSRHLEHIRECRLEQRGHSRSRHQPADSGDLCRRTRRRWVHIRLTGGRHQTGGRCPRRNPVGRSNGPQRGAIEK
jgi:hypothetical protein